MGDANSFLYLLFALLLWQLQDAAVGEAVLKKCCAVGMQLDRLAKGCEPYIATEASTAVIDVAASVPANMAAITPEDGAATDNTGTPPVEFIHTVSPSTPLHTAAASVTTNHSSLRNPDAASSLPTPSAHTASSPNTPVSTFEEKLSELRRRVGDDPWWLPAGMLAHDAQDPTKEVSFLASLPADPTVRYASRPCHFNDTKHIVVTSAPSSTSGDRWKLLSNGTLLLTHPVWVEDGEEAESEIALSPQEFCADRVASGKHVFLLCPCKKVLCINKCCKASQLMDVHWGRKGSGFKCALNDNDTWIPSFHHNKTHRVEGVNISHVLLYGHQPQCSDGHSTFLLNPSAESGPKKSHWILGNGSAMLEGWGHGKAYGRLDYCADWSRFENGLVTQNVYFCEPKVDYEAPDAENVVYTLMFLAGALGLALTLAVYVVVPELRRTAHAKALMCHVATLAVAMSAGAAGHLRRRVDATTCVALAFVLQYFFLATFFWLNVMCFDISWTFRNMRRARGRESRSKKFLYYSLYAWGCPTLILAITLIMEYAPGIPDTYMKPNIGVTVCWFDEKLTTFAYYYGPMAALLVANAALFATTALRIRQAQRGASVLLKGDSAKHAGPSAGSAFRGNKNMYKVFLKLFCLMGVTWLAELVSWLVEDAAPFLAHVLNAINLLRSVAIFFIFCWKRNVWRLLRPRLARWRLLPAAWREPEPGDRQTSACSTNTVSMRLEEVAPSVAKGAQETAATGTATDALPGDSDAA